VGNLLVRFDEDLRGRHVAFLSGYSTVNKQSAPPADTVRYYTKRERGQRDNSQRSTPALFLPQGALG
jgi:hypothetical protein